MFFNFNTLFHFSFPAPLALLDEFSNNKHVSIYRHFMGACRCQVSDSTVPEPRDHEELLGTLKLEPNAKFISPCHNGQLCGAVILHVSLNSAAVRRPFNNPCKHSLLGPSVYASSSLYVTPDAKVARPPPLLCAER